MDCSWAWKRWSSNINHLSWASLPSRPLSHESLPSRSLRRAKSALLKSSVVSLLFPPFLPLRILNSTIAWPLQLRLPLVFIAPVNPSLLMSMRYSKAPLLISYSITWRRKFSPVHSRNLLYCLHPDASLKKKKYLTKHMHLWIFFLHLTSTRYILIIFILLREIIFPTLPHNIVPVQLFYHQSISVFTNYKVLLLKRPCDITEKDIPALQYLKLNTWKTHWVTNITERVVVCRGCFYVLLKYYWVHFVSKYRLLKCLYFYKIVGVKMYDHSLWTEL